MANDVSSYRERLGLGLAEYPERIQSLEPINSLVLSYGPNGAAEGDRHYYPPRSEAALEISEILYNGTCMELLRDEQTDIDPHKVLEVRQRLDSYLPEGYIAPIAIPFEMASYATKLARDTVNPFNSVTPSRRQAANRYEAIQEKSVYIIRGLLDSLVDVPSPTTKTAEEWADDAARRVIRYERSRAERGERFDSRIDVSEEQAPGFALQAARAAIRSMRDGTAQRVVGGIMEYHNTWTALEAVGQDTISVAPLDVICAVTKPSDSEVAIHMYKPSKSTADPESDSQVIQLATGNSQILRLNLSNRTPLDVIQHADTEPLALLGIASEQQASLRTVHGNKGSLVLKRIS